MNVLTYILVTSLQLTPCKNSVTVMSRHTTTLYTQMPCNYEDFPHRCGVFWTAIMPRSVGRDGAVSIATTIREERAGRAGNRIPVEDGFFHTRPDRPWGRPSLLYNGNGVSSPGVKRPGRGTDHQTPPRAEVKGRVQLYLYSPSGPSWPLLRWNLPSPLSILLLFKIAEAPPSCRQYKIS